MWFMWVTLVLTNRMLVYNDTAMTIFHMRLLSNVLRCEKGEREEMADEVE